MNIGGYKIAERNSLTGDNYSARHNIKNKLKNYGSINIRKKYYDPDSVSFYHSSFSSRTWNIDRIKDYNEESSVYSFTSDEYEE